MNRRFVAVALCLLMSVGVRAHASPLSATPRLLLDAADIAALKVKVAGPFAGQWAKWRADAEKILAAPVQLPPRGGNWSHHYVCPEHGARLTLGKQIGPWQWEHICPVGNHVLYGNPKDAATDFDGNAISQVHYSYAEDIVTLGVAYRLTDDVRYARRAREILLGYADKYQSYPIHDNNGIVGGKDGGHVASQSLTESSWLIPFTQGADLVWDTLSTDEQSAISNKVLRPALDEVIRPTKYGPHNVQCRRNSAIGLVGLLLGDQELIHEAIDDPKNGFKLQIAKGVQDDGMWFEGANGYHFFALEGLWPLAEAARHHGVDLYSPRFKSMFDAPLTFATPNLSLPNFNDSETVDLGMHADVYELAYARWKEPAYLRILDRSDRSSRLALLYGVEQLPDAPKSAQSSASHNSPPSGYAVLQSGPGTDATWLCMKYGPHGGAHGHPDKNSFVLYAGGDVLAADAGTHAYGSPLHAGWDQTTIAHNTLVVDEISQGRSAGKSLAFGSEAGVDYAMTDAGPIYPDKNVRFIRTVAMVDADTIVGIDRVTTDGKTHTFDIAFHLPGAWSAAATGEPWLATGKVGYPFIEPATSRRVAETITLNVTNHARRVALTLLGSETTEVITGTGIGESTQDHVPVAIFRRTGSEATFVWCISLGGHAPEIADIPSVDSGTSVSINGVVQIAADAAKPSVTVRRIAKGN